MTCQDAYKELESPKASQEAITKALGCLRDEIASVGEEAKRSASSINEFNGKIGSTGNLLKDYKDSLLGLGTFMRSFTTDIKAQYQITEKLAEGYKKSARSMGLSIGASKDFTKEFKGAVTLVSEFGGDIDDVKEIYESFAENSGRVRILGKGEVNNIWQLQQATQSYGTTIPELYEALDLMGVSNQAATDRMLELIRDSEKVGLNSSKVVKVLAQNMKSMQSYSFQGGVRGMTEMAKLGVKLRTDVSSMLSMADKFYQPEAAIEAAANLQMLGGDIAEAFGDPFETMYLARNKPEELAKKLQGMTENMMTLNTETGEYEFPPEVRMQLKSAGEQLGFNTDQMIEMARQTSKMKDVKDKLSMGGMFSEEEMEGIASMSRLEGGKFVVDVRDEEGNKVAKSIDELTQGDLKMLITTPKDESEYMTDMIYQAQTTNKYLENMSKKFQYGVVEGDMDAYVAMEEVTNNSMKSMTNVTTDAMNLIKETYKQGELSNIIKGIGQDAKTIDDEISKMIDGVGEALKQPFELGKVETLEIDSSGSIIINTPRNIYSDTESGKGNIYSEQNDFILSSTGKLTPFTSKDDIVGAKSGGPLDKLLQNSLSNVNNNIKVDPITVTINGDLSVNMPDGASEKINMDSIKPQIVELIKTALNGSMFNQKRTGNAIDNFG